MTTEVVSGTCFRLSKASRKFAGMNFERPGTESIATEKAGKKDDSTKELTSRSFNSKSRQVDSQTVGFWRSGASKWSSAMFVMVMIAAAEIATKTTNPKASPAIRPVHSKQRA